MLNSALARAAGSLTCLILLAVTAMASLVYGNIPVTISTLLDSLFAYDAGNIQHLVIRSERVSRTVVALTVGAGLAVAGVLMQSLTRNPLASPGILGINAGALFFVVAGATLFSLSLPSDLIWLAFLGGGVAAGLVLTLGQEPGQGLSPVRTVLAGVAITALFVSFSQGLLMMNQDRLESLLFWLAGSVSGRSLDTVMGLLPIIAIAIVITLLMTRQLNLLGMDDEVIQGLGLNVVRTRLLCVLLVIALAGTAVAIAGLIGFVGLIVPHITRAIFGTDHRWLLPASALIGAALLLIADTVARLVIPPQEIPVGVVTALLGTPLFLHLARKTRSLT